MHDVYSHEVLARFRELWCEAIQDNTGDTSTRLTLWLLYDESFKPLEVWKKEKLAHGHDEDAYSYVSKLVTEAALRPPNEEITIRICRPWSDYRALASLLTELRAVSERPLRVYVDTSAFGAIPQAEFYRALTVSTITDTTWPVVVDITAADARTLVEHGCRGFARDNLSRSRWRCEQAVLSPGKDGEPPTEYARDEDSMEYKQG